ncbi:hypothetical protein TCAL_16988 [Tigriopus californicus]|uniref:Pseudouridine synthase I TruA alpha/beta domain-containing protein n=1 Tax=Tigriopus californicus TaxID=6832 RepID=A0A553PIG9_TIGCA|nr:hypothetical protein TCAL_16988 [Tigriopus californicus]
MNGAKPWLKSDLSALLGSMLEKLDGLIRLRALATIMSDEVSPIVKSPVEEEPKAEYPWRKAKKVACLVSFSGINYYGMQRNPSCPTIEEELLRAFRDAGAIPSEWYDNMQKSFFQRASRTDKGVSAIKMIISLKMLQHHQTPAELEKVFFGVFMYVLDRVFG